MDLVERRRHTASLVAKRRELFYSVAQGYGPSEPNSGTIMSVPI
jgi:hypothetical protein